MEIFERQRVSRSLIPPGVTVKWADDVLDEGFVPFPKKLLRCLPAIFNGPNAVQDLAVVLAIADFRRLKPSRFPSLRFLAFIAGLSPNEFRMRMDALKDRQLISVGGTEEELELSLDGLLKLVRENTASDSRDRQ